MVLTAKEQIEDTWEGGDMGSDVLCCGRQNIQPANGEAENLYMPPTAINRAFQQWITDSKI